MEYKEIILTKITSILSKSGFFPENNSIFKKILKCCGLDTLYNENSQYLLPHTYNNWNGRVYENPNPQYDLFIGLDNVFTSLYASNNFSKITELLIELAYNFHPNVINFINEDDNIEENFKKLQNLYEILGLSLSHDYNKITVTPFTNDRTNKLNDMVGVEKWLFDTYPTIFDSYKSAISSYKDGHLGACIESCRTTLTSIFSQYKGTEEFAKWLRGISNLSAEIDSSTVSELKNSLDQLKQKELADFFAENARGKFTKTKAIYTIYSMMSDYGTHRGENAIEVPTQEDALMMLRMTDDILIWIFMKHPN